VVVDIGAHGGDTTCPGARQPEGNVSSPEPGPPWGFLNKHLINSPIIGSRSGIDKTDGKVVLLFRMPVAMGKSHAVRDPAREIRLVAHRYDVSEGQL
jgi:hypothetical protein